MIFGGCIGSTTSFFACCTIWAARSGGFAAWPSAVITWAAYATVAATTTSTAVATMRRTRRRRRCFRRRSL